MRLKEEINYTIEIEKSRFICYMNRVFSEQEARDYLAQVKKIHPTATHHCYGYTIGSMIQRSSDNGEPAGTAGIPILQTLLKSELEDTIAIVVRYFGGIKLGAGGLIRAYTNSVSQTIGQATLVNIEKRHVYNITFSYDLIGRIEHFLSLEAVITNKEYNELVTYSYLCKESLDEKVQEITNGKYLSVFEETIEVEVIAI